ncbi:speedy protein A [Paragonimus heterotremus]|uniref:Speedy protein A n=1 Tax=Paragonimus heterotremus TaxID=100268 RepID=A0A8J4T5F2_9TREM|nr:speedy protein A [Paragonimus heterotremus]
MEWALSWFEKISIELSSTRKRKADFKRSNGIRRKNIRHTPSTIMSSVKSRLNKNNEDSKSPMFIMNGNWAPSPRVLHDNMMKAYVVKSREMNDFFRLLCTFHHLIIGCLDEDTLLKKFLEYDSCYKCADNFNLASVFAYFKRCNFELEEYNRLNFFCCLYLVHDMEEDDEDYKYEIFPWALGSFWMKKISSFLRLKETIWARMNYRAVVSYTCCKELMSIVPDHPIWRRERPRYHGKVTRAYAKEKDSNVPRGPEQSPPYCMACQLASKNRVRTDSSISLPHTASRQITRERSSNDSAFGSYFEEDFEDFIEPRVSSCILHSPCEETWLSQETCHSTSMYSRSDGSYLLPEE